MCKKLPYHPTHLKAGNIMFNAVSIFFVFLPLLYISLSVSLLSSAALLFLSLFLILSLFSSLSVSLSLSQSFLIHFSSFLSFFLTLSSSLSRPGICAVSAGGVIWCRKWGVIDNGAAFSIKRAVFAFKGNETETETGEYKSSERDKKARVKKNRRKKSKEDIKSEESQREKS